MAGVCGYYQLTAMAWLAAGEYCTLHSTLLVSTELHRHLHTAVVTPHTNQALHTPDLQQENE